jgi:hypothetical protein
MPALCEFQQAKGEWAMIIQIGIIAGEIWHHLDTHGDSSFSKLSSAIDKPRDLILMSLGWLAREGHVVLKGEGDYTISLRKQDAAQTTS